MVVLVATACTKQNPEACCTTQEDCAAIGLPIGTDCGDGLTCIGNSCVATSFCQAASDCPSQTPQCGPDGVCVECLESTECGEQVCSPAGQCVACMSNDECADGFCVEGSCKSSIIPKYLPTVCDTQSVEDLILTTPFDTSDDASCDEIVVQGTAPDICVVHANTIVVNGTVDVTGNRSLALVADRALTIEGTLDAGGSGALAGPGASSTSGGAASATLGGGGAGQQTAGGSGGKNGGSGGLPIPDPA